MRARLSLLALPILMTSLESCAVANRTSPLAVAAPSRAATIKQQLAPICPDPLTDDELEKAARLVETHRDPDTVAVVGLLDKKDREARLCRGM